MPPYCIIFILIISLAGCTQNDDINEIEELEPTAGLEYIPINETECAVSVGEAISSSEIVVPSKYNEYIVEDFVIRDYNKYRSILVGNKVKLTGKFKDLSKMSYENFDYGRYIKSMGYKGLINLIIPKEMKNNSKLHYNPHIVMPPMWILVTKDTI